MSDYDGYEGSRQHEYNERKSHATHNVAPIPAVVDPERREACRDDLKLFLETYFAEAFPLQWSDGHLEVLGGLTRAIEKREFAAIAMPRGSGKTTMIVRAALWAVLYGKCRYVMIVAAGGKQAKKILKAIKDILRANNLLMEDFPEVCAAVRKLDGLAINGKKQHHNGVKTEIEWGDGVAQLPQIEESESFGARIEVMGVEAAGRGGQVVLADGRVVRPDLALIDDFQTRKSAASPLQCQTRLETIAGDLANMDGPEGKIAMLAAITVIHPGDGADQLLDRQLHPEWHGVRQRFVESWPTNEKLWDHYTDLRLTAMREDRDPAEADAFYAANRAAMDAGSEVTWEARHPGAISAIQYAFNKRLEVGEAAFCAEYQNDPLDRDPNAVKFLTADEIAARITGVPSEPPYEAFDRVTAGVDVQQNHLWYTVVGWRSGFGGEVLRYGAWPDQKRRWYTKRALPHPFSDDPRYENKPVEAQIFQAIRDLLGWLAGLDYPDGNGTEQRVARIFIDEGFKGDTVHRAIAGSTHRGIVKPCKGIGVTASRRPMSDDTRRKGEPRPRHDHWRERVGRKSDKKMRSIHWDTNFWKTFLHQRFLAEDGDDGALRLAGSNPSHHTLIANHLSAQTARPEQRGTQEVIEWSDRPMAMDKDLMDCLAMACVAASYEGLDLSTRPALTSERESRIAASWGGMSLSEYCSAKKREA